MEFKELLDFVKEQDKILDNKFDFTGRERVLSDVVKLGEEFGELCDEVLGFYKGQRDEKMTGRDADNLSKEFADVLIVLFLLANKMDVDILDGLEKTIEKVRNRNKMEGDL